MKKSLLLICIVAMSVTISNAQIKFGVKAGANLSSLYDSEDAKNANTFGGLDLGFLKGGVSKQPRLGYHVGVMAEISLMSKFALQPEVLFSAQGSSIKSEIELFGKKSSSTVTQRMDYVTIPVMAKYYVTNGLSLELGPQVGFLVSTKLHTSTKSDDSSTKNINSGDGVNLKENFNTADFGANFGIGYNLSGLNFGLRYNLGLTDITKTDLGTKNGVFQVSVGYFF